MSVQITRLSFKKKPQAATRFLRCVICLLAFALCQNAAAKESLHAILVADLHADDIEIGVAKDLSLMQKQVRQISKYTGMPIQEKVFRGRKQDPYTLMQYLAQLEVAADDVIFFYFSGHGFRTKQDKDLAWPHLSFELADIGLPLDEIASMLQAKQARLSLLFVDCCNNKMSISNAPKVLRAKWSSQQISQAAKYKKLSSKACHLKLGYNKLFNAASGLLVVASAKAGEYSFYDDDDGSMATLALIKSLKRISQQPTADICWASFIDVFEEKLASMAKEAAVKQHAVFYNAIIEDLPQQALAE